ncbi:hypothetical protein VSAK1_26145 [Vibrio mediterranei AK1]|uniref:hypothetical protein n=1 Tax=Vibrio mediterranei TaxID=689 RepID=UPI0001540F21|nr:hypothetical protein [Vibrio mediterranei]EDL53723.1 hypothetical protein VSAK1_26145 [Vibrio mediterranei AK1]
MKKNNKNLGGRPRKPDHEKATEDLRCRITKNQKQIAKAVAKRLGLKNTSDLVFLCVFGTEAVVTNLNANFIKKTYSFNSNLNQLLKAIHTRKMQISDEKADILISEIINLKEQFLLHREELRGNISNEMLIRLAANKFSEKDFELLDAAISARFSNDIICDYEEVPQ